MTAPHRFAALVATVALVALAAPVSAAAAEEPQQAVVTQDGQCTSQPDYTFASDVRALAEGQIVLVGRVDGEFTRLRGESGQPACWVTTATLSGVLPEPLDPARWETEAVVVDATGIAAVEILTAGDMTVRAAPSGGTEILREVEAGDLLTVADWSVTGGAGSLAGQDEWTPVSISGGVPGWIRSRAIAPVPDIDLGDLTGVLVPERDVPVHAAPSSRAETVGTLTEGEPVAALMTPTAGWYPVTVEDRVGWVSQSDLVATDPPTTPEPTVAPTPDTSEPGVLDDARTQYEEWKAERDAARAAETEAATSEPGLWERMSNAVTGHNPVAEAAARARLWLAGGVGLLTLLLAGLIVMTNGTVRRGASVLAGATGLLAPGLRPAIVWLPVIGAPAAAVVAAWFAPTEYHQMRVATGAALVGGAVAAALALRVATFRGADRAALMGSIHRRSTALLLLAGGVGVAGHLLLGASLALATVVGLLVTGLVAGFLAPAGLPAHLPEESAEAPAAHLDPEETR